MKNTIKWLAVITFTIITLGLSAQQAVKLGHIESNKLLSEMPEVRNATTSLETRASEIQKNMEALQREWETKITDYTQNMNTYSDIVRASKEQELQDLQGRIQRFEQSASEELQKLESDLMSPIYEKVRKAIEDVGRENNFSYIFDLSTGGVIYVSPNSQDILALVKQKLGI